jgi:hypothetical protein
MGVHAPDIKEEYKEFKALEGSRFGLCTRRPAIFAVLARPDWKPWRKAAPGNYTACGNSIASSGIP